jgi:hypothetical protein
MALFAGLVMLVLAGTTAAQSDPNAEPTARLTNGGLNHTLHADIVTGLPFSAEQVQKRGRTLQDGTNIEHFGHHFIARDSAGRVRVEQPCGCLHGEQTVEVYVIDPVARRLLTWREGGESPKIATSMKLPDDWPRPHTEDKPLVRAHVDSTRPQPIISTEQLPIAMLDGLPLKETKTTTIVPAGRSGNDRPITKTHEVWVYEDLKVVYMEQWTDPRSGVRTVGLAKLSRAELKPELFQQPRDYQLRDSKEILHQLASNVAEAQP